MSDRIVGEAAVALETDAPATLLVGEETAEAGPRAIGSATAPTPAVDDDDDAALLGATHAPVGEGVVEEAQRPSAAEPGETQPALTPEPEPDLTPAPDIPPEATLADLFGGFEPNVQQAYAVDPANYDVMAAADLFGGAVSELDLFYDLHLETEADDHRDAIVNKHQQQLDMQPVRDIFGEETLEWLIDDYHIHGNKFEDADIVVCEPPRNPYAKGVRPGVDELWLLDMTKVQPNRQVLHFDSKPFEPKACVEPRSSDRHFFTPQNTIHWSVAKSGKVVSNARIVRWSDGSATLHVGPDVYELLDNNERVLAMLAAPTTLRDINGASSPALIEAVQVQRHVSAITAPGRPNSVNEALVKDSLTRVHRPEVAVKFAADSVPVLRTDQERNKAPMTTRGGTEEEQFMTILRQQREKPSARSHLTPYDVIREELTDYATLCEATRDMKLKEQLKAALVAQDSLKLQTRRAPGGTSARRNKFERSTADETAPMEGTEAAPRADDDMEDEADELLQHSIKRHRADDTQGVSALEEAHSTIDLHGRTE